ncbi:unnamed protein product [Adineta steineri]|uniref:Uncharacterized protein n=1 Tax=Adineta steineri TaxID=433720 RepID=A0A815EMP6_9BILA|nr:unnamed protein product [Adineta steineri]CAF3941952.1 unnamed protein product [Adineta steineri]
MYSNGTAGSISIQYQNANPLLYTLQQDQMTTQPYWIMVLQLIGMQLFQRLWNLFRYHVFLTTTEIAFMRWALSLHQKEAERRLMETSLTTGKLRTNRQEPFEQAEQLQIVRNKLRAKVDFDAFDFVFQCLPLCGHGIWYCHIQSSCMSAEYATKWNCYNAFGYRIYNYIFVSYVGFFIGFIIKLIALLENKKTWEPGSYWECENYIYTMSNEFNTRDTSTYIGVFRSSVNQRLHTFLDFV